MGSARPAGLAGLLALALLAAAPGADATPILGGGAWSYFTDPRAVHDEHDRTFVGWVNQAKQVVVASIGQGLRERAVLGGNPKRDDHDNPALVVRGDGRVWAFYAHHDGRSLRYRVSRLPGSVAAWGREHRMHTNTPGVHGYTYPNPVELGDEHRLWLFWRGGNWNPTFSVRGRGRRWSRARTLVRVPRQRPYVKYDSDGRRTIGFAFTEAHPRLGHTSIWYAEYRGGALWRAGGRRIATMRTLPIAPRQADRVYDGHGGGGPAWVQDVAGAGSGRPVIIYVTFPPDGLHRFRYARWDGTRWQDHQLAVAGRPITAVPRERLYSGGATLDHRDPSLVYLSRQVGPFHEIEEWRTPDGGITWSHRPVTAASGTQNVRPVAPRGLRPGERQLFWMRGTYGRYQRFHTVVAGEAGSALAGPPLSFGATGSGRRTLRFAAHPDGHVRRLGVAASWRFGDGRGGVGPDVSHRYVRRGDYTVRLTLRDEGRIEIFAREVTVR